MPRQCPAPFPFGMCGAAARIAGGVRLSSGRTTCLGPLGPSKQAGDPSTFARRHATGGVVKTCPPNAVAAALSIPAGEEELQQNKEPMFMRWSCVVSDQKRQLSTETHQNASSGSVFSASKLIFKHWKSQEGRANARLPVDVRFRVAHVRRSDDDPRLLSKLLKKTSKEGRSMSKSPRSLHQTSPPRSSRSGSPLQAREQIAVPSEARCSPHARHSTSRNPLKLKVLKLS